MVFKGGLWWREPEIAPDQLLLDMCVIAASLYRSSGSSIGSFAFSSTLGHRGRELEADIGIRKRSRARTRLLLNASTKDSQTAIARWLRPLQTLMVSWQKLNNTILTSQDL